MDRWPHVVIIGGGFGGLNAARALARAPVRITLLDRRNHHLFQPLLYQVATAALNPSDIAYPIRSALAHQRNARVLLAEARSIDVATRTVTLDGGELQYDYLILATGATHSYFGKDQWAKLAPGLKSVEDAIEIRRRIFIAYEAAERESDPRAQEEYLTFAVVGGGPTGVELAGAMGEIGLQTLAKDFRSIDPTRVRVVLFEGADRVLRSYPEKISVAAKRALEKRHVEVRVNTLVTGVDDRGVTVKSPSGESRLGTRTVVWAAGVQASPLGASLGAPRDRSGRILVEADCSIPDHPEVFVIGDLAKVEIDGVEVPGVAQGAIQEGKHVAKIIAREARGDRGKRPAFRYHDKGNMAVLGRADAVLATKHVAKAGFIAWLAWAFVHIAYLISYRSRLLVMIQWAWSFTTFKRGARLITGEVGALPPVTTISASGEAKLPAAALPLELTEPEREAPRASSS
ncbi:MAG: NAD(P)/FAD-dependent oxidoreductase [Deltaproteobacteria bacterium]|nr:NAD(P)/FAD-dependent oxidoreductase [Deltaproteobacteria bacterium]